MFDIRVTKEFKQDLKLIIKENKNYQKKIERLIEELKHHPKTGTGKPEQLKHFNDENYFSRRITKKHRLIYKVDCEQKVVYLISCYGHYK